MPRAAIPRLPVYHDTIDNIIGVVHEKDCFAALQKRDKNVKLEDLIGPTLYTTSVTQISALLRTLRESKHHMAVVVDEYGGTAGIITLEDILEELVGEIWDEHDDVVEDVRQQSDGSWLIISTLLPSAAWCRKSSAACLRWGTGSSGATLTAPSPAPRTAASRRSA